MSDSSTIRRMIRGMNAAPGDRTESGNGGAESGGAPTSHTESELDLSFLDAAPDTNLLGRFGKFEVLSILGSGGMGYVLKALDTSLGRIVALKILSPFLASNAKARKRFTREGRAAASINHPNVVSIYSVDDSLKLPYLVMEFVDGVSLHEHIKRRVALTALEIETIAVQMAAGLSAAHSKQIIHRDIKPANVMLGCNGHEVKITDFGLAKLDGGLSDITTLGSIVGTPAFMSPEQVTGGRVDVRSDLFSLGCVIYAMATGNSPFEGNEVTEILHNIAVLEPAPLHEVDRSIPLYLSKIVSRLLQKDPEGRFWSASELETELQMSCTSTGQTVEIPLTKKASAFNRLRLVSVLAICLAIATAATAPLWWPQPPVPDNGADNGSAESESEPDSEKLSPKGARAELTPEQAKVERSVAHSVLETGGFLRVLVGDGSREILGQNDLPDEDFVIESVDHEMNSNLTDVSLEPLADLRSLKVLQLSSSNITGESLSHVGRLTTLDYLGLAHTEILDFDSKLESLVKLQNLTRLNLNDTAISDAGLKHVLQLENLKKLYLSGTMVTGDGLKRLATESHLEVLELNNTYVTDTDIKHLKDLTSLKKLSLQSTQVTASGVDSLQQQLPGCEIIH